MAQLLQHDNVYIRKGADSSFIDWPEKSQNLNFDCFPSKQIFFIIRLVLVYGFAAFVLPGENPLKRGEMVMQNHE